MAGAVPVVCAIIERHGRFLAAQRAAHEERALLWEFPGGKIKKGETAEAALVRELREELGIDVSILSAGAAHVHSYQEITIELIPFVCSIANGEPRPHEHAAIQWVSAKEAKVLAWAPADVPVLEDYLKKK